jgi:hypothetical protein
MSYDLNDAQPQMAPIGELIPDGTFAKVRLTIRPGGVNGATPADAGLLRVSQGSDAMMLDCEFTVVDGLYARRKFWQSFTVAGGRLDEKGQSIGWKIAKSTFRAMIDSALGLNPQDMSEATRAKRVLPGLKHLDGIVFAARIMVEPASNTQCCAQNRIANVVLPIDPRYAAIMRGETVPPEPVNAALRAWPVPVSAWWGPLQPLPAASRWGTEPLPIVAPMPAWGLQYIPNVGPAPQALANVFAPSTPAPLLSSSCLSTME